MESLNCYEIDYDIIDISNETKINNATTIKLKLPPINDENLPTVSIVTPTYNRSHFYELIIRNFERIDYPREKLELIILDDSEPDKLIKDIITNNQIKHIKIPPKLTIGQKRNMLCEYAKHEYIVHMDDDDWYPQISVVCRIRILLEYQKKINKTACFGCSKVLCLDLISNQMFEAYDVSINGTPATISESTMAYSKDYWSSQKWDPKSITTECLPFIKNRHDTVCTGPSVFIITQFSHGDNTILRRISRNSVSDYNAVQFQQNLSVYDSRIFNNIRAGVIYKIPSYAKSLEFISLSSNYDDIKFKKEYKKLSQEIKDNPLIINLVSERLKINTA